MFHGFECQIFILILCLYVKENRFLRTIEFHFIEKKKSSPRKHIPTTDPPFSTPFPLPTYMIRQRERLHIGAGQNNTIGGNVSSEGKIVKDTPFPLLGSPTKTTNLTV